MVRSPSWSWDRRARILYRRSNRVQKTSTGANKTAVTRPSHQLSEISRPVTAANVMIEMKMNTSPKPANRLIEERSVVARESSWPDCHSSWNAGSSRCRCR